MALAPLASLAGSGWGQDSPWPHLCPCASISLSCASSSNPHPAHATVLRVWMSPWELAALGECQCCLVGVTGWNLVADTAGKIGAFFLFSVKRWVFLWKTSAGPASQQHRGAASSTLQCLSSGVEQHLGHL